MLRDLLYPALALSHDRLASFDPLRRERIELKIIQRIESLLRYEAGVEKAPLEAGSFLLLKDQGEG